MSRPTQYATIPKMGDADEVGIDGVTYTGAQLRAMIAMTTPTTGAAELPEALRFTKKPVTIEAIQWTGKNLREVITFTDGPPDTRSHHAGMAWEAYADLVARDGLKIYTLEGKMLANVGDWIIRGVKGEFYPCKPDIFEATYSPAALVDAQQPAPLAAAHVGDLLFESWFSEYNPAHRGTKQQMRDAYAAGMGDPKAQPSPTPQADSQTAPQHEAQEPVAWLSVDCIGERYLCFTRPDDDDPVRPLVFGDTAPQAVREPFTPAQQERMWRRLEYIERAYDIAKGGRHG